MMVLQLLPPHRFTDESAWPVTVITLFEHVLTPLIIMMIPAALMMMIPSLCDHKHWTHSNTKKSNMGTCVLKFEV